MTTLASSVDGWRGQADGLTGSSRAPEVSRRVDPAQLAAADAVLRAALFDDSARQRASRLPRP